MAQALGLALRDCGMAAAFLASRDPQRAESAALMIGAVPLTYREIPLHATHVIIAVSDRAIGFVAEEIAAVQGTLRVAVHTCGSYGPDILAPLARVGVSCGGLHPLQTLREPRAGAADLRKAAYAVAGEGEALSWAEEIAHALSGTAIRIPDSARPLYHAAAVAASNYLCALLDVAEQLLVQAGANRDDARGALEPLMGATLRNALERGPLEALTGPIVRGDSGTVERQMNAVAAAAPESVRHVWQALGMHTAEMAKQRGLGEDEVHRVLSALGGGQ